MLPLSELDVLFVDCQATAAAPRGHLLELGWARPSTATGPPETYLVRLPHGERIPPAVARITGISERMLRDGVEARTATDALRHAASRSADQPSPAVAHFALFEQAFLNSLPGAPPLDLVCTHRIARRLLPDLPRASLRAVAGYFGRDVGLLRRSASHVEATAFVWRELVRWLEGEGVLTWTELHRWLAARPAPRRPARRAWPMPREVRLGLPDAPGLYRLLRTSGDVLYVGKAASLRARVNSYFRKQHGVHERTLEMLSQARTLSFDVVPSALEAALIEPDEIKRHRPPYNIALTADRAVWFAPPDLRERRATPSARYSVGPFPSAEALDQFGALVRGDRGALGPERWAPDRSTFEAGFARLCAGHIEMSRGDLAVHVRLLRLGMRLWREGRRDRDGEPGDSLEPERRARTWTPEFVQVSLEWLTLRTALALRRAQWLTRLVDVSVVWSEPGAEGARLIVIEHGEVVQSSSVVPGTAPPLPPGHGRPTAARRAAFTIARFDRLRVLTTEFKRLVTEDAPVAVRFGVAPPLTGARLARALSWL